MKIEKEKVIELKRRLSIEPYMSNEVIIKTRN